METGFNKQSSTGTGQQNANNRQQEQATGNGKTNQTGEAKAWYERLAGTIPEDKEEQKKWYKMLTHPLAIIVGLITLGYWWFKEKERNRALTVKETEELKAEMARLKKKYKKLKKRIRKNNGDPNRFAVLD